MYTIMIMMTLAFSFFLRRKLMKSEDPKPIPVRARIRNPYRNRIKRH